MVLSCYIMVFMVFITLAHELEILSSARRLFCVGSLLNIQVAGHG